MSEIIQVLFKILFKRINNQTKVSNKHKQMSEARKSIQGPNEKMKRKKNRH